MKLHTLYMTTLTIAALSASGLSADDEKRVTDQRTIGEKTSDALSTAGEKTKDAGQAVLESAKDAGRAIKEGTAKAVDVVKDAVTPDADARRVDVTLNGQSIDVPGEVAAGKTAFVVRNSSAMQENFRIQGMGIDEKFLMPIGPNESKTLHVNLKPGTYEVKSAEPTSKLEKATIVVK